MTLDELIEALIALKLREPGNGNLSVRVVDATGTWYMHIERAQKLDLPSGETIIAIS